MLQHFPRLWLRTSAVLVLVVSAGIVPAHSQQPAADITFALPDASHSATWPVAVREVAIDGKPIRLDQPVHVEGAWLRTVTVTLRNVSPKTIVRGGIGVVFPAPGADLRLTFTTYGDSTQAKLAGQLIHQATLTFTTFYFADDSRWSAQQHYLPPLPGTRQWRRATPTEFLHPAE